MIDGVPVQVRVWMEVILVKIALIGLPFFRVRACMMAVVVPNFEFDIDVHQGTNLHYHS